MAHADSHLTYAQESATFVEQRARADLAQTLERAAGQLEHAANVLRRMAGQGHVPVPECVEWAQHEIACLLPQLDKTDDHLGGLALVWADARQEIDFQ
jgi:hypothetical protein